MSRFSEKEVFGQAWEVVAEEKLSKAEINEISSIEVKSRTSKDGENFLVMVFFLKKGGQKSEYLSKKSDLTEGDQVDPKSVKFIELEQDGKTSFRVDGDTL